MTASLFRKIYDTLGQIDVHGHKNVKRMTAAMDALWDIITVAENKEKEGEAHENLDEQRKDA